MEDIRAFKLELGGGKPDVNIYFLHSKTYVAELWHGESKTAAEFATQEEKIEAVRAIHKMVTEHNDNEHGPRSEANTLNIGVINRDGWVEAVAAAKDAGVDIKYVETNAPRRSFDRRDIDCYPVNETRQNTYVHNTYLQTEYVMDQETAGIFCVAQSHRIATAESTPTLFLALDDPRLKEEEILQLIGKPGANLTELMENGRKYFLEFG